MVSMDNSWPYVCKNRPTEDLWKRASENMFLLFLNVMNRNKVFTFSQRIQCRPGLACAFQQTVGRAESFLFSAESWHWEGKSHLVLV